MVKLIWNAMLSCLHDQSLQLCLTQYNPMDCSLPGYFVHGILQARILVWVAMFYSRGSSQPRDQALVFCIFCTGRWVPYN